MTALALREECINWPHVRADGRARLVNRDGVDRSAYVWAFLDAGGVLTDEKPWVLHHCDNPACVNPEHLYAGDRFDNARDATLRGRHVSGFAIHHRNQPPATVLCPTCGVSFPPRKHGKRATQVWCSPACYHESRR